VYEERIMSSTILYFKRVSKPLDENNSSGAKKVVYILLPALAVLVLGGVAGVLAYGIIQDDSKDSFILLSVCA